MKNFKSFSIASIFILTFFACYSSEDLIVEDNPTDLLKSYTIKRDATGAYSLGYELSGNAIAENNLDVQTNTNEIHLYASDLQSVNRTIQHVHYNIQMTFKKRFSSH